MPLSATVNTYDPPVAPAIFFPFRNHWKPNVTGAGFQAPVEAVSFEPTFAEPVTFGVAVDSFPAATFFVVFDFVTGAYPTFAPVTFTVIFLP